MPSALASISSIVPVTLPELEGAYLTLERLLTEVVD